MPVVSLSTQHFNTLPGAASLAAGSAAATGAAPAVTVVRAVAAHPATANTTGAALDPTPIIVGPLRAYAAQVMPTSAAADDTPQSMGLEFYVTADTNCIEIRFWQPPNNKSTASTTAIRTGAIWRVDSSTTGTNLSGTQSFATPVDGWNTLTLSSPLTLTANQRYRAVVYYPAGRYTATAADYYNTGAGAVDLVNGVLVVPNAAHATGNAQNSFLASGAMAFPTNVFNANQYGIDVGVAVPPGRIYLTAPAANAAGKASSASPTDGGITHGVQLTSSNTGIPAGTPTLTPTNLGSGELTSGNYTEIEFSSTTYTTITASNSTFTRCRFLGGTVVVMGNNNTFTNCEFVGGLSFSSSDNNTITRGYIHTSAADLSDVTGDQGGPPLDKCHDIHWVECLFNDSNPNAGDHADGMQIRGSDGLLLRRCRLDMGPQVPGPDHWKNSALFPENANGGNSNMTVENCFLNGGGYMLYLTPISGTSTFTGNRFGPDFDFGYVVNSTNMVPTTWTGNVVDATGATVPYTSN